jgi:hypothetical protein
VNFFKTKVAQSITLLSDWIPDAISSSDTISNTISETISETISNSNSEAIPDSNSDDSHCSTLLQNSGLRQ